MAYSSAGGAAMFCSEAIIRKTASEIRNEKDVSPNLTANAVAYKAMVVTAVKNAAQNIYAQPIKKAS